MFQFISIYAEWNITQSKTLNKKHTLINNRPLLSEYQHSCWCPKPTIFYTRDKLYSGKCMRMRKQPHDFLIQMIVLFMLYFIVAAGVFCEVEKLYPYFYLVIRTHKKILFIHWFSISLRMIYMSPSSCSKT